mmetsp:Transcript_6988/g.7996  ORF Transcript_6988/g.7996 Transcript_6988/m.7996 type:complete len:417 (-) Transcript_6988:114-1364(-)
MVAAATASVAQTAVCEKSLTENENKFRCNNHKKKKGSLNTEIIAKSKKRLKPSNSSPVNDKKDRTGSTTQLDDFVGAGLDNLGNTCYMNSILQCLIHTCNLIEKLSLHKKSLGYQPGHNDDGKCILCCLYNLAKCSQKLSGSHFEPKGIHSKIPDIAKKFLPGRQEDAHEFLRLLLDSLDVMASKQDKESEQGKRIVNDTFGGKISTQVTCTNCGTKSGVTDPIQDLSLEIDSEKISTIEDALEHFTESETLDGENKYSCEKCKEKTVAQKQIRIHDLPPVLVVQLKRFQLYKKVSKRIPFLESLEVDCAEAVNSNDETKLSAVSTNELKLSTERSSKRKSVEELDSTSGKVRVNCELYGIVVHSGFSRNGGHYFCYLKRGGSWYRFDDSIVSKTTWDAVKSEEAYILFYKTNHGR